MHYLSRTQEGPPESSHGRHLRPVIITADKHFHTIVTAAIPDLQHHCIHALSLEYTQQLWNLFGNDLLLFIDIDSYDVSALINFMSSRYEQPGEVIVIGLSDCDDLNIVISYLKSGISGYFLKSEMNAELIVHTIMTLLSNGYPLSASITQKIIQDLIGVQKNNYDSLLSKREQVILHRLVNGLSYKMIAYELNISIETVRHHIKNIYKKLGVNSKGEVIAKILKSPNPPPFM